MDFSDFVGLPWEDRGRGPAFDCWGLFVVAFRAATGIELPSHDGNYSSAAAKAETAAIFAGDIGDWTKVTFQQEFDGAVMFNGGALHVGLVVRPGQMLHMPRGRSSVIEPLSRFKFTLYRHSALGGWPGPEQAKGQQ